MTQTPVPAAVDPAGFAQLGAEAFAAWASGCMAWGDYLVRLSRATGHLDVLDAGEALMRESLACVSRAAAVRLDADHLGAPLLTDA